MTFAQLNQEFLPLELLIHSRMYFWNLPAIKTEDKNLSSKTWDSIKELHVFDPGI